jgi:hypothetical protein
VKNIRWLVLALVVVGGIWGGLELRARARSGPQPLFPDYKPETAARITIKTDAGLTVLEKRDQVWLVTSEDSLPAARQPLDELLAAVGTFSRKDRISSKLERQSQYQVDSTGVAVTVKDGRGRVVASLVVGKTGPDYQSTYVRDTSTNDVILAQGRLGYIFNRGKRSWQDKRVFSVDPADVAEVGVSKPTGRFVLKRGGDGKWYVSEPESTACEAGAASRLVKALASLEGEKFAGRTARPEWGLAGGEPSVWLKTTGGAVQGLAVGGRDEEGRRYAVRTDRTEAGPVHLIPEALIERILPDLADVLPKAPESSTTSALSSPPASPAQRPTQPEVGR